MIVRHLSSLLSSLALLTSTTIISSTQASLIVSESKTRLPMSLSTVISDLEAEGMSELSTACLITSRSVTAAQQQACLEAMLGQDEHLSASSKAVATVKGLALAQPSALEEVVQSCVACEGLVIYLPSPIDLARGEGLLDHLAPAMERLLQFRANNNTPNRSCLVVVCDETVGTDTTKQHLEAAAQPFLQALPSASSISALSDIFESVLYVTADQVEATVLNHDEHPHQTTSPEVAMALVASVVAQDGNLFMGTMPPSKIASSPTELAAARVLEPAKRLALQNGLGLIKEATNGNTKLVPAFGALCDAVLQQAKDTLGANNAAALQKTSVGSQLSQALPLELSSAWMDALEVQLELLQDASFASFRQNLGKLRLGPTLASDMDRIVQETVQQYGKASQELIPKQVPNTGVWKSRASDSKSALSKKLSEFCRDRLVAAEASGQFKPVPRKGVTIGMHWLLPKPFGNDFRQEPWTRHATDNLVYVPRRSTKVTEIPAEDVLQTNGDWRDQVVPSPAGKDMLYMQ